MDETSQEFEAYVPVYDSIPDEWENARVILVEYLKKISTGVNTRTIGWLLDEELLSGQAFIPGQNLSGTSEQYRSVLRKVIDVSPLVLGVNVGVDHGITFDANFTLIDLWVSGTNSGTLTALRITGDDVLMNSTQIVITSPQAFDRAYAFAEYIQEI